jgi:2-polyprenyl-6-methoxyphenol hydroxylase-like FAD-dependent oxidoreductase
VSGIEGDGARACVTLAAGEKLEADLVLAADGMRSALRGIVAGSPVAPRPTGVSAWRGVASPTTASAGAATIPQHQAINRRPPRMARP